MRTPPHKRWSWKWLKRRSSRAAVPARLSADQVPPEPRIGLALGGGFARGIAHVGILRVLERENIPLHCITGVSAGSIVAAAYASGATPSEIAHAGWNGWLTMICWRCGLVPSVGRPRRELTGGM